jgi:hypothetical protein
MSDLFQRRRQIELQLVESKIARQEQYQQQLAQVAGARRAPPRAHAARRQIRVHDAEGYTNMKITLENNIQVSQRARASRGRPSLCPGGASQMLEQQLEEMRATYQLNAEVCRAVPRCRVPTLSWSLRRNWTTTIAC